MELELFQAENGPCPYRPEGLWVSYSFDLEKINPAFYEQLMRIGFRRSGHTFYKNNCPGCNDCIPIRIPVDAFKPSKSQRRNLRKNEDIVIQRTPVKMEMEAFELYKHYVTKWHKTDTPPELEEFYNFLVVTPLETQMLKFFYQNELVGISWVDILPRSLSSVYFAFNPDFAKRGPGIFSLLKEIELCKQLRKKWLYLGFWVKGSPNMSYKSQYHPHELMVNGEWITVNG